jgi:hypothetical protein
MLDRDIRPGLMASLRADHPDAAIFEEFPVCRKGRADLAAVNSAIWGYEIKSERDTLNRLPRQIEHYECIFDFCTVVAAERHLNYATQLVPSHWGIFAVHGCPGECSILEVRKPQRNPNRRIEQVIRLLWKNEVAKALRVRGIKVPRDIAVRSIWKMLGKLPVAEIDESVRVCLKSRNAPGVVEQQTSNGDSRTIAAIV